MKRTGRKEGGRRGEGAGGRGGRWGGEKTGQPKIQHPEKLSFRYSQKNKI